MRTSFLAAANRSRRLPGRHRSVWGAWAFAGVSGGSCAPRHANPHQQLQDARISHLGIRLQLTKSRQVKFFSIRVFRDHRVTRLRVGLMDSHDFRWIHDATRQRRSDFASTTCRAASFENRKYAIDAVRERGALATRRLMTRPEQATDEGGNSAQLNRYDRSCRFQSYIENRHPPRGATVEF